MGDEAASATAAVDLTEAHRRLLADKTLQFDFGQAPPPPKPPPDWLVRLLEFIAPMMKYVFWGLLILAALLIIAFLLREVIKVRWQGRARKLGASAQAADAWRPQAARARVLLAEADALAAQGLFAEAAHHLLLHSIQDVEDHRPRTIRPALTSRDIARLEAIPPEPKAAFHRIAQLVETSLFGGRSLGADGFAECRRAYETFAFEGAWS
jgi:hypothetical protein